MSCLNSQGGRNPFAAPTTPFGSYQFAHDHDSGLHQGLGNVLLPHPRGAPPEDEVKTPPFELHDIQCNSRLGGLLKHYYREAA